MRPLEYAIDARIPESQVRIREIADEMILLTGLLMVLEALQLPQNTVAKTMGISLPPVTQLQQRGNDLKIATLKRYIKARGVISVLMSNCPRESAW